MPIENACASLSSQKIGWHDKKWTNWSNFTLNQQKITTKTYLIPINVNKSRKKQYFIIKHQKKLINQSTIKTKNK
ncbi:hypothetical protein FIG10_05880 [Salmonella enterica]|nr:hypothetical protein [Salmonella enterica]ECC8717091.1 hypothetical protein [Salmonella enterica subsp. houtenae]EDQ1016988.1 hypothetical protein [Salmonella enterica subsp. houtenae serovar 50:z4,z23:-]EDR6670041.1 hypothetical protein [Salmonella enterica subsp. enterica]EDW0437616.1 hypothetical protein [Salmonella enterica subsp. arizonae serovar 50:z4,z23:-]HAC6490274.1 hypothetical protein [Salmonella enterica subsp. houtenae serovar 44:z36[z38]:-]HAE7873031.1 hypothetical protein [